MGVWQDLWKKLTDFSAAEENQREVESILREALSYKNGDGDFDENLHAVLTRRFGRAHAHTRYLSLLQMMEVRRSGTHASRRVAAAQLLRELPQLYGQKK